MQGKQRCGVDWSKLMRRSQNDAAKTRAGCHMKHLKALVVCVREQAKMARYVRPYLCIHGMPVSGGDR